MQSRRIPALLILTLGLALGGCSGHEGPSDARMAQQITQQFDREFGGNIVQIERLKKSQGHLTAKGHYIALVHFDMRFTKSLADVEEQDGYAQAMELRVLYGRFGAGETRAITDEVLFAKENGDWVLINSKQRR